MNLRSPPARYVALAVALLLASTAAPSGTAPSTSPRPTTAKPLPRKVATRQRPLENGDRGCERLRSRLDTLDDRMRAGYSSRESERLWQQWRELKTEIHRRRC
jgi:hypothetical protein